EGQADPLAEESSGQSPENSEESAAAEDLTNSLRDILLYAEGWGGGFMLNDGRVSISELDTLYTNSPSVEITGDYSAVIHATEETTLSFINYAGWTYPEILEVTFEDGTVEQLQADASPAAETPISLENVTAIRLIEVSAEDSAITISVPKMLADVMGIESEAPALYSGPRLMANRPAIGETTTVTVYGGQSAGRAYETNYGYDMFCVQPHAPAMPSTGQVYQFISQPDDPVLNYILYNYYAGMHGLEVTYAIPDGWEWPKVATGVLWLWSDGTTPESMGYTEAGGDVCRDFLAHARAYGGGAPENSIQSTVYFIDPVDGNTSAQRLVTVGGPLPPEGFLQVYKTNPNQSATFLSQHPVTGAVYGVYTNQDTAASANSYKSAEKMQIDSWTEGTCATLTIGPNGYSDVIQLDPGNYWVIEIGRPDDSVWQWDKEIHAITVTSDHTQESPALVTSIEDATGYLALQKSSANAAVTSGNGCYSLIGATYEIYDNAAAAGTPVATLIVKDEQGNSDTAEVMAGRYWYKETVPGKGYALKPFNSASDYIDVAPTHTADNPAIIKTSDVPNMDPIGILLQKSDKDTGEEARRVPQ
ncbi:MAG: hypothetical protein J6P72_03055, partial [Firmicutes bacterium]|nr:hypothetical protein [Bacillota bacterium]